MTPPKRRMGAGRHRLTAMFETGTRYTVAVRTDPIDPDIGSSEHLGAE
ncbi:hypothetical protein ACTMTI_50470 [Nonomuraea sp. H19]